MKKIIGFLVISFMATCLVSKAQTPVDSISFFADEKQLEMTLTTDIKKLQTEKKLDVYQPATVTVKFPDNTEVTEEVRVCARGHVRREICTIPPLMMNFHNMTSPLLNQLGKLKLVIGCGSSSDDEQMILKEYLIYKMYNMIEGKSFRVRLVLLNYKDSRNKMKSFSQYAFFLEDDGDLAARIDCVKKVKPLSSQESTDRNTMTMVALFQYMVSNSDWSVANYHNIKVLYGKKTDIPYAIPYDFDNSGLINTEYAVPSPVVGTESVTERVYRGFPRTMEELQTALGVFRNQKDNIYSMIKNHTLLKNSTKKQMTDYLDEFYKTINNNNQVQSVFIKNARK